MVKGTVKRWMGFKDYGFIETEAKDDDVFVHISDVDGGKSLKEGDEVEFEIQSSYKGPKAVKVKVVS